MFYMLFFYVKEDKNIIQVVDYKDIKVFLKYIYNYILEYCRYIS